MNIGGLGYVGLNEEAIASSGADESECFFSFGLAAASYDYFGSGFGEEDGGVTSDAGSAAGDDGDFIL